MRLTSAADSSLLPSLARVIYNGTTAAGLYIATLDSILARLTVLYITNLYRMPLVTGRETDPPAPEGGSKLAKKKVTPQMERFTSALYNVLE